MPTLSGFNVFCSNHPSLLLQVARRKIEQALEQQSIHDLRPIPVLVPSAAIRDRLRDDLAEAMGVCAGIELLLPAEFAARWLPQRLGITLRGTDVCVARWRICAALDTAPIIAPAHHDFWDARRLALATRVTDALVRVSQWATAESVTCWQAGLPSRFDAEYPFLAHTWPCIVASGDPVAAHHDLLRAIADATDLPPAVLAITTPDLSPVLLEIFSALGQRTLVQVVLSQPVPGDWSDQKINWKNGVEADAAWTHRLLAQWGDEHNHALRRLDAAGAEIVSEGTYFIPPVRQTLLAHIQRDIAASRAPTVGVTKDSSLVFQHTYGRRAEIEAVKHRLASWMTDQAIPPHKICIACPQPEAYAGLLAGIFSGVGEGPVIPIDVRPVMVGGDPAVTVAQHVLELMPSRWTATQILALLELPPIATAWKIDATWIRRVRSWCDKANLRFGADDHHRAALQLPEDGAATWRQGLQRLAWSTYVGYEVQEVACRNGVAPVEGLDEADVVAFEKLAELLVPLLDAAADWRQPHTVAWWSESLIRLTRHLRKDQRDVSDVLLCQSLGRLREEIDTAEATESLLSADAIALALTDAGAVAPIRYGGIVVDTPAALRGHSWDIVCCIGMDDGAFPRQSGTGDVDPLIHAPVAGQPDPRHQDRAALLDLLVAAEYHVLISWIGYDAQTGEALPPCPAVGDILEVVRASVGCDTIQDLIDSIGLGSVSSVAPGPWPSNARRFQAITKSVSHGSALVPAHPLPPLSMSVISLDHLMSAIANPPRSYLRRLGIRLATIEDAPVDYEQLILDDHLENWKLKHELMEHIRSGSDVDLMLSRWVALGKIPSGTWGRAAIQPLIDNIYKMIKKTASVWNETKKNSDVIQVTLNNGTVVSGYCPYIHPKYGPVELNPGSGSPKHRQRAWLNGLLWQAAGREESGVLLHDKGACHILHSTNPRADLEALITWYRACLQNPCPLVPDVVSDLAKVIDEPIEIIARAAHTFWETELNNGLAPCDEAASRFIWPKGSTPWDDISARIQSDMQCLGVMKWSELVTKTEKNQDEPTEQNSVLVKQTSSSKNVKRK